MKSKYKLLGEVLLAVLMAGSWINGITSSLWKMLVASLAAYWAVDTLTAVQPLRPAEVLDAVLTIPADRLLTAVGILAAYVFAVETWRMQKRFELKLHTAAEVGSFFKAASDETRALLRHAEDLLELRESLLGANLHDRRPEIGRATRLRDATTTIQSIRGPLAYRSASIHDLRSRHEVILNNIGFSQGLVERAVKSLVRISEVAWFHLPGPDTSPTMYMESVATMPPNAVQSLRQFCEVASKEANWLSAAQGGIEGGPLGGMFRPTIWTYLRGRRIAAALLEIKGEHNGSTPKD